MTNLYTDAFFDLIEEGCRSSAAVVVPLVVDHLRPQRVIDVGCGRGWWAEAFQQQGCTVHGIDGPDTRPVIDSFTAHDLNTPLPDLGLFDLAVSLEVAEHLPPARADSFIVELCALAPVVLFSAAIPGQGGTGHLNEQPIGFWVELFEANGYTCSGALRWMIWEDERVANWYRQNLLVAAWEPAALPELFDTPLARPWPVVHPILFDARRRR